MVQEGGIWMAEEENPYCIHDPEPVGEFSSPAFLARRPDNPVLTKRDMPYPAHLVFNCSVSGYWFSGT
jgi:hypothetical protein